MHPSAAQQYDRIILCRIDTFQQAGGSLLEAIGRAADGLTVNAPMVDTSSALIIMMRDLALRDCTATLEDKLAQTSVSGWVGAFLP